MYEKIITHNDFDGLASAAICSFFYEVDFIQFAGPNSIANAQISIGDNDIVCDLPYPLSCGRWFDHHEGNIEELKYRNIDPATIPGHSDLQPSCARVCFNFLSKQKRLPAHFTDLVAEADMIDSFDYQSIEDWRRETPGKIIDAAIRVKGNFNQRQKHNLMREWIYLLRDRAIAEVAQTPSIQSLYQQYLNEEAEMLKLIRQNANFHPHDTNQEIIILDFIHYKWRPSIIKNLAYLEYPRAKAVLELNALHKRGTKTNNFGVSMALSLTLNGVSHQHDVGEIMRELNIGDGHAGAAGGTVYCRSKNEMLNEKSRILDELIDIWQEQESSEAAS